MVDPLQQLLPLCTKKRALLDPLLRGLHQSNFLRLVKKIPGIRLAQVHTLHSKAWKQKKSQVRKKSQVNSSNNPSLSRLQAQSENTLSPNSSKVTQQKRNGVGHGFLSVLRAKVKVY